MSVSSITTIMERIATATACSPIAVFRAPVHSKLDAVFANTVSSLKRIECKDPMLVGVYTQYQEAECVKADLVAAC